MWLLFSCVIPSPPADALPVDPALPPLEEPPPPPQRADPCEGLQAADGFGFPVGGGDASGYYDAQPFGRNTHLGSDWNARTGGNTDYGHRVDAIGDGIVTEVVDVGGGWGLVLRIAHRDQSRCVESLYAHLSEVSVALGERVARGQRVGAIGDAGGIYYAHLHLEVRSAAGLSLGGGYGRPEGQIDPTAFISARRPK